jgi:hypothetical protein
MRDGEVDVRISAERPQTVAILSPHVDAMVADARAASIAVARMSVDYAAGGDRGATSDMDTDRGSRQRAEATDKDNPDDPAPATATRRVRIVL